MSRSRLGAALRGLALGVTLSATPAWAHSGPPYPIVSNRIVGAYKVSIWTDPDASDDGSLQGKFWVTLEPSNRRAAIPADTRAHLSIRPLDRTGPSETAAAAPVDGDPSQQYVALLMDHEGRFGVHLTVGGALGRAEIEAEVEATYDSRPPPIMLIVYAIPFLLVGLLWAKLLRQRRRARG